MQDAVLAAFLITDDELHRDAGFARPNGPRPVAAITDQIARIILLNVKQAALLPRLVEVNWDASSVAPFPVLYTKSC